MRGLGFVMAIAALLASETVHAEDAAIARGAYLVNAVAICGRCHTTPGPDNKPFAGGRMIEGPGYKVQGSNITPDPETGIGSWSDEQIGRAITQGLRPDGSRMSTAMPYNFYAVLTDTDRDAIVAYLRSLAPVKNRTAAPIYATPPAPAGHSFANDVASADTIGHGKYLGLLARCLGCHSTPRADGEPDLEKGLGQGGASFEGPWGVVVAPDITPRALSGWSDDDIRRALVEGITPDGRKLAAPMQARAYAQLTTDDLASIVAWLRSLSMEH
ncbi:c-type cytochrome [Ancylobacter sp. Lp-2]|uniref:c-type cytochrome n=1 Tax=Ancylobacter sp. Lp-2 TaxID=2881339 RepID=UPI001E3F5E1B|nr:c-type cytochrome [Ancylobacter sp. Lp-2]MCB4771470.1 c-type cytochrome [Ancylobacter sp. Lp-2]